MGCSCSKNEIVVVDNTQHRSDRDNIKTRSIKSQLSSNQLIKFKLSANIWKQDKQKIFSTLNDLVEKYNMSQHLNLLSYHNYAFHKEEYDTGEIIDVRYFTFIKKSDEVKWHKKPFQDFYMEVENFFQDPKLIKYKQFYWQPFIQEYEENWLKFTTRKVTNGGENNEEFKFSQKHLPNMPIVLTIFGPNDDKALLKLMELNHLWDVCKIFPVVAERISNKKEIMMHRENLEKLNLNLRELYFIGKKSEDKIEKHIPFTSDDNMNNFHSKVILIDSEGYVRKVCDPEKFSLDFVDKLKNSKLDWNKNYEEMVQHTKKINNELKTIANINLKKCRVYEHKPGVGFKKVKVFYEPLHISTTNIFNNMFTNASIFRFTKFKKKNELIVNEIKSFNQNIPCNQMQYAIKTIKTKKFVSSNKKEAIFTTSLFLQFTPDDFLQGIASAYVQGLEAITTMPFVNFSYGIYALPLLESSVPYFNDMDCFKLIFFFSIEEKELDYKLKKIEETIQDRAYVALVPLIDYNLDSYKWKVYDKNEFTECFSCTDNIKELFTCLVLNEKSSVVYAGDPTLLNLETLQSKPSFNEEKFRKRVNIEILNFVEKFNQPVYNLTYTKSKLNEDLVYENIKLKLHIKNLQDAELVKTKQEMSKLEDKYSIYIELQDYECVEYSVPASCMKCGQSIYGGLYFFQSEEQTALCDECVKMDNKIQLYANFIPKERTIIKEYFEYEEKSMEKLYNSKCSVCNKPYGSVVYISLINLNVLELGMPILICERPCFEDIVHKKNPDILGNFKRLGGSRSNLILKRLCLPSY